jgi:hypothetical protein
LLLLYPGAHVSVQGIDAKRQRCRLLYDSEVEYFPVVLMDVAVFPPQVCLERARVSFVSTRTEFCCFGQIDIGHSLGKPYAIKMNLSKAHITCNETITYAAAGVLFAWEPYAMTVTADRAHSSKEALAMKHTYMYMLGTCPASRSCSLACLSIATAILPLSRSHAAVARRQENVPASEVPAGLACPGLPAVERLELAPHYAAEVCFASQRKSTT